MKNVFIALMAIALVACSEKSDSEVSVDSAESDIAAAQEASTPQPKDTVHVDTREDAFKIHPCDVVTEEYIKSLFPVDNKTFKANRMSDGYPNCFYTWRGPDIQTITVKEGGKLDVPKQCAVSVTIVDRPISLSMYEQSIRSYPDKLKELPIGDACVWSAERRQLTARKGQKMFHVHVDCYNDNSKNEKFAAQIAGKVMTDIIEVGE